MGEEYYAYLAMCMTRGATPSDCFGLPEDPQHAFDLFRSPGGLIEISHRIGKRIRDVDWAGFDRQLKAIEKNDVSVLTFREPQFPRCLAGISKPPPVLFYKGNIKLLYRCGVAIVGSRMATVRGCHFAKTLASGLAGFGVMVASGLARGIDTAAHRGALEAGGPTVAFIGTGLDVLYPRENKILAQTIAREGCVVTEQLMGTPPMGFVFPLRNRLISASSQMVVVVEAAARSGALVTAEWAQEQGRAVGAVPGFPGDARSRGANRLIKDGASAIESVADIFEAAPALVRQPAGESPVGGHRGISSPPPLGPDAAEIFHALGATPVDVDSLAVHLDMNVAKIQRVLFELEIQRLVARDQSGGYYATK